MNNIVDEVESSNNDRHTQRRVTQIQDKCLWEGKENWRKFHHKRIDPGGSFKKYD